MDLKWRMCMTTIPCWCHRARLDLERSSKRRGSRGTWECERIRPRSCVPMTDATLVEGADQLWKGLIPVLMYVPSLSSRCGACGHMRPRAATCGGSSTCSGAVGRAARARRSVHPSRHATSVPPRRCRHVGGLQQLLRASRRCTRSRRTPEGALTAVEGRLCHAPRQHAGKE